MTAPEPTAAFDSVDVASPLDEMRFVSETGQAARIAKIAEPTLQGLGFRLVRVKLWTQSGSILQIMAERPDGTMTIEDCELASQNLSPVLDVEDAVSEEYRLEISSPGIDRPLVRVSDFLRAMDAEIRIELSVPGPYNRKRFRGHVRGVTGAGANAELSLERIESPPAEDKIVSLRLADLDEAKIVLTDSLIRETLRAEKAAEAAAADAAAADAPKRGPGRFAMKNAGKAKPVRPAGVQAAFKKSSRPGKPGA